jgi:hypothetical protein
MNKVHASSCVRRDQGRRRICAAGTLFILAGVICADVVSQERVGDAERRGRELAKRVLQLQDTSGFQIRARVIIGAESDDSPRPSILQVRIVGRREIDLTRVLFQILWPNSLKGLAAVIENRHQPPIAGFLFEPPDRVTRLTPALLSAPFAGSGLTLEDLAEDFWQWPQQRVAGQGHAGQEECTILESRPSPAAASAYSLIRSCISLKKAAPLWVEKLGGDGRMMKRITIETPDRKGHSQDFRTAMVVEGGVAWPRTRVEILKNERGIAVSPDEFSVARLRSLGARNPMYLAPMR